MECQNIKVVILNGFRPVLVIMLQHHEITPSTLSIRESVTEKLHSELDSLLRKRDRTVQFHDRPISLASKKIKNELHHSNAHVFCINFGNLSRVNLWKEF